VFFSSRRRHTRFDCDWSSDVCSSDLLNTPPVVAHRNRITYLVEKIKVEIQRCASEGRQCRIFNLGCGPAKEIQDLLATSDLSNQIGRASCRERVKYTEVDVGVVRDVT